MEEAVQEFTVTNETGLHARAVAILVKLAMTFDHQKIWIENKSRHSIRVQANNFLQVLSLACAKRDVIQITIEGSDPQFAMQQIAELFKNNFGEEK